MLDTFRTNPRYVPYKILGRGSFGTVCAAHDTANCRDVAVKRLKNVLNDRSTALSLAREINILRLLHDPHIVELYDISIDEHDVYLVIELCDTDLHRVICSSQELSPQHIKYFAKQLLLGIRAIHQAGIMHRDLKPQNILVMQNCRLKIADFGKDKVLKSIFSLL